MAQLSIFRFYYIWSMLSREEHFNSNQEEYKEAFLLRVLPIPCTHASPRILHCSYLFLSVLDGELEPVEGHLLAVGVGGAGGVVVEQHLQLVRRPRVVQQRGRELLALVAQLLQMAIHK